MSVGAPTSPGGAPAQDPRRTQRSTRYAENASTELTRRPMRAATTMARAVPHAEMKKESSGRARRRRPVQARRFEELVGNGQEASRVAGLVVSRAGCDAQPADPSPPALRTEAANTGAVGPVAAPKYAPGLEVSGVGDAAIRVSVPGRLEALIQPSVGVPGAGLVNLDAGGLASAALVSELDRRGWRVVEARERATRPGQRDDRRGKRDDEGCNGR